MIPNTPYLEIIRPARRDSDAAAFLRLERPTDRTLAPAPSAKALRKRQPRPTRFAASLAAFFAALSARVR